MSLQVLRELPPSLIAFIGFVIGVVTGFLVHVIVEKLE